MLFLHTRGGPVQGLAPLVPVPLMFVQLVYKYPKVKPDPEVLSLLPMPLSNA